MNTTSDRTVRRSLRVHRALLPLAAAILLAPVACSSDDDAEGGDPSVQTTPASAEVIAELSAEIDGTPGCDWLDTSQCLFPFPSSQFESEADTDTGRRLTLPANGMPVNVDGSQADPEPFARSDGWGVGTPIMVSIPGISLEASGYPTEDDISVSVTVDSGTVLMDLTTGERLAHWVELDRRPEVAEEDRTTVLIRPAALLPDGHKIAVGLERPVDGRGTEIPTGLGFRVYRDGQITDIDEVEQRRAAMEELFTHLGEAGVDRDDLWLAWDFQIASTENLTGEMISMRDQALTELGDTPPAYEVTEVLTDRDGDPLPDGVAKWVRGTFEAPSFIEGDGSPGQVMNRDAEGEPQLNGTYTAEFTCVITQRQLEGTARARPVVYGHGLLGSYRETERRDLGTAAADLMLCGTYWVGMSDPDIGFAVTTLGDIDHFPSVADRLRQGIVNQLVLARLIGHADGIGTHPEVRAADGTSSVDTSEVFYEGHSQGGIMGVAATAVSTEWTKAIIGVPGTNYSMLIPRSNNWQVYGPVIAGGYPDAVDSLLVLALLQQQWDRGEGSGYARHLLGGLPGTPDHQVIIQVALSDHQVANATSEVTARTAGVPVRVPVVGEERLPWAVPPFGLDTVEAGETADSVMIYWDAGTLRPPLGIISPDMTASWAEGCNDYRLADEDGTTDTLDADTIALCSDPHEFPRRTPAAQEQRNEFFATGKIEDVCGDGPCLTEPR